MGEGDDDRVREIVAARVAELVKEPGQKQRLVEKSGVPVSTLNRIIKGLNDTTVPNLRRIAEAANVSLDWLAGFEGRGSLAAQLQAEGRLPRRAPPEHWQGLGTVPPDVPKSDVAETGGSVSQPDLTKPDLAEFVKVPMLKLRASAGNGQIALQMTPEREDVVSFREDWLRRLGLIPGRAEAMTAVGDSMEPTIRDGDLLLVDRSIDRVINHGIYVLVYNGAVLVKRVQLRLDGSLVLMSDNERYRDETVPANDASELIIEGRVRWFGRMI